jgi:hypothetical protein
MISLGRLRNLPNVKSTVSSVRWLRLNDRLLGSIAIISGVLSSIPFGIGLFAGLVSVFFEPSGLGMIIFCFPLMAACIATVHCGLRLWRTQGIDAKFHERPPLLKRWDKMMGIGAVVAGFFAVIGVVAAFAINLST